MSSSPKLHEILSNFPEKYGKEHELKVHNTMTDKNVEVANSQLISDIGSRFQEHIEHNSGPNSTQVVSSLPELIALDPDLVAEQEKKKRRLRKSLN